MGGEARVAGKVLGLDFPGNYRKTKKEKKEGPGHHQKNLNTSGGGKGGVPRVPRVHEKKLKRKREERKEARRPTHIGSGYYETRNSSGHPRTDGGGRFDPNINQNRLKGKKTWGT